MSKPTLSLLAGCAVLSALGCAPGKDAAAVSTTSLMALATVAIEGRAAVPFGLIADHGASLVANNGGAVVVGNTSRFGVLATSDAPVTNALVYLTTPDEQFYKQNGKMVTTTTDADGHYRFASGVPRRSPVIVSVILSENRRVVGFTVPDTGTARLDVSLATTYVTEFLRLQAAQDHRAMADYALAKLPDLARRTARALDAGTLGSPDLNVGHIPALDQVYALAVGRNLEGLGDAWGELLGHRVIAAETAAGSGVTDSGGDGKAAKEGEFYRLKGVCVDHEGNVFLADEGNHRVRRIDAKTGLLSTVAGTGERGFAGDGGAATKALLNFPRAVVLDRAENLFIFDSQNVRIRRIDKGTGVITTFAGNPTATGTGLWNGGFGGDGGPATEAQLFSPRGGAFDSRGNLYVTDGLKGTNFHTIRKITPDGIISTYAGVPKTAGAFAGEKVAATEAKLNYTNQLFITRDDQLYLADSLNHCVRKIDLATHLITTVAGVGGQKAGEAEPDGQPATATHLNSPYGVAVDREGQVFISERGFHRLLVVKTDGKLYTVGGGGSDTGDGDARLLSLSEPHDLWFDRDDNLLLTDARASKLRRFFVSFGL